MAPSVINCSAWIEPRGLNGRAWCSQEIKNNCRKSKSKLQETCWDEDLKI
jgi:hypothetical protein